jgi:hypothetical protein
MKPPSFLVVLTSFLALAAPAAAADPDWKPITEIMAMTEEQVVSQVPEQTPIECADPAAGAYLRGVKEEMEVVAASP